MRITFASFALVSTLAAACSSSSTKATANGVFPSEGFAGRTLRVEISGDATNFSSSTTISMGSGITVGTVSVASPTDLFADITIAPTAALGMTDVTITDGKSTLTLSQAFEIVSPVEFVVQGNAGQGGLPFFTLVNHDSENPFDGTTDANGNYVNLMIAGPTGTSFSISAVTDLSVTGRTFIDTNAAAGAVTVTQGNGSAALTDAVGQLAVTPRTPTALTNATPTTGMIATIGDSQLYSLTATAGPAIAHVAATTTDTSAALVGAMFPDGTWANSTGLHTLLGSAGSIDLVLADNGEYGGYSYTVTGAAEALTLFAQGTGHTSNGTALAETAIPAEQTGGMVTASTYVQEIKITVDAGHANKSIELTTGMGTDPMTGTAVDIVDASGKSYLSQYEETPGTGPVDANDCSLFSCTDYGDDVISDALPAGDYFIKITASPTYWTSADQSYLAVYWYAD